jgi:hypothetical protein
LNRLTSDQNTLLYLVSRSLWTNFSHYSDLFQVYRVHPPINRKGNVYLQCQLLLDLDARLDVMNLGYSILSSTSVTPHRRPELLPFFTGCPLTRNGLLCLQIQDLCKRNQPEYRHTSVEIKSKCIKSVVNLVGATRAAVHIVYTSAEMPSQFTIYLIGDFRNSERPTSWKYCAQLQSHIWT